MEGHLDLAWSALGKGDKATRKQLLDMLHFAGLNPTKKVLREYCGNETEAVFTRDDLGSLAQRVPALLEDDLIAAFSLIDENGDGSLSKAELHKSLAEHGERMTVQEIDDVLAEFDSNKDKKIDYKEFTQIFTKFAQQVRSMKPPAAKPKASAEQEPSAAASSKPKSAPRTMSLSSSARAQLKGGKEEAKQEEAKEGVNTEFEVAPVEEQEVKEPKNLKEWDCDRLGGTLQVEQTSGQVTSEHYTFSLSEPTEVFVSLKLARSVWVDQIDLVIFVVQTDTPDGVPKIVGSSMTHLKKDPMLRMSLNPGDYVVFPYSFGSKLKKRTAQPKKSVTLCKATDSGFEMSKESKKALGEIFARLDLDSKGTVDRKEYDLLLLRTDGETSDDETWEYLKENFDMEDGCLKLSGFLSMYEQVLAGVEGKEEDFYSNFEQLGYNRRLELDEAVTFRVFVFVSKTGVMSQLKPAVWDKKLMEDVLVQSIKNYGQKEKIADKLYLHTYRDALRVSFLVENKRDREVTVKCDCSASKNAKTNRESLVHFLSLQPNTTHVAHHLVPDDLSETWQVTCGVSVAE